MLKLYAIEFTSNLAVELWGERRKPYKAGDRVLITRDERLMLLRLGCKQLGEKEVNVDDVFTDKDFNGLPERVAFQNAKVPTEVKKGKNDKAEKVEAPKVEELAPAETPTDTEVTTEEKVATETAPGEAGTDAEVQTTTEPVIAQPEAKEEQPAAPAEKAPAKAAKAAPKDAKKNK